MNHSRTHQGCQTFRFLAWAWCVSQAQELIEADPSAAEFVEAMDITSLDGYLDLTPVESGRLRLFVVAVDTEYALTRTNLEEPILVVRITNDTGEDLGGMVIDGWHRAYRARREGRTSLAGYVLSAEAEQAVRIPV